MSMHDLRNSLNSMANAIEALSNTPSPAIEPADRSISGNKLNGGIYTNFRSVGIKDISTYTEEAVLVVENDKIVVDKIATKIVDNDLKINGNLTVDGEVVANKLHVNELTADVRNERTTPLEFKGESGPAIGKGLIWTGGDYTMQFTLQGNPSRLFSSESIDIPNTQSYMIAGQPVISDGELGPVITSSSLTRLGTVENLSTDGNLNVDNFVFYESGNGRLGLGTEAPNGIFSVMSFDHELVIDETDNRGFKLGTYTTSGLDFITDDTVRISISDTGNVSIKGKTAIDTSVGIGVKNFSEDVSLTTAKGIRVQGKKQEVAETTPKDGSYQLGDIVWNTNPQPTGYVGWICVRAGVPGDWRPFGQIGK